MTLKRISVAVTLGLGLATLLAAGLPALAQEADAPAADGLSMGQPESGAVGSTYSKASFDQWEQRCVKTESGQDPCQLYQLLKDGENAVAEINLFDLPAGGEAVAGATVIAPLETLLPAGLRIAIDTAEPKVYPFTFCARIGCVARVGFTAAELEGLKKGAKAVVTIVPAADPNAAVVLDVSLKGFTAGYEAVVANNAALPAPEAATEGAAEGQTQD